MEANPIAAAGKFIQGVGGYEAGRFNAKASKLNARNAEIDGAAEEAAMRDQARLAIGEQIASQGGGGMELGTGSALDALDQSATNAELDAMAIRRRARLKATGYRVEAANQKAQAIGSFVGGAFGAASTVGSALYDKHSGPLGAERDYGAAGNFKGAM